MAWLSPSTQEQAPHGCYEPEEESTEYGSYAIVMAEARSSTEIHQRCLPAYSVICKNADFWT